MTPKDERIAKKCRECKGHGEIYELEWIKPMVYDWVLVTCPICKGTGVARPDAIDNLKGGA